MQRTRFGFPQFAWSVLAYNLAVIMWGAYVRATGSGAGCGNHWPLCDGVVIPRAKSVQLLIELSHRVSSGFVLVLVAILVVWAFRRYQPGSPVRAYSVGALVFTLSEALIGALLVKFQLVAHDTSVYRSVAIASHLTNTFILLAALTFTAYIASGGDIPKLRGQGPIGWAVCMMLAATLILGITGAITALGDTLAIQRDISSTSLGLARIRLIHPLIAVSVTLYCVLIAGLAAHLRPSAQARNFSGLIAILFLSQIGLGLINKLLLAPVWMQLLHLLVGDLVWIALVLMVAATLGENVIQVELKPVPHEPQIDSELSTAGWRDYLVLTKPRVISLLLFTTLTAMVIAKGGWPGTILFIAVAVGGYMSAGAANAINMVIDRDIDGRMKRTATRPTVTEKISSRNALLFGFGLALFSFLMLWLAANLLCAVLSLSGLVFYVIVYTLMLKRRTWHNIVIGGAAGAFPPLVGWAAVTNDLSLLAWYLFAIIFVWTPVHFWALALLIKDDYASAGVPMLPVVLGERITVLQIGLYAILTAVISVLPLLQAQNQLGALYLWVAGLLNVVLLGQSMMLYRRPDRPRAKVLFKYSMIYLALLFLTMAVDRSIHL